MSVDHLSCDCPTPSQTKKPTWPNTLRYSTTSAYSSTGLPAQPDCPSSSHSDDAVANASQPYYTACGRGTTAVHSLILGKSYQIAEVRSVVAGKLPRAFEAQPASFPAEHQCRTIDVVGRLELGTTCGCRLSVFRRSLGRETSESSKRTIS